MIDFIIKILETLFIEEVLVFIPLIFLFYYSFYSIYFKKKIIFNFFLFLFPITFLFYSYSYLPNFFSSLGQDSILELKSDLGETLFYLKTFFLFLFDPEIFKRNRFWLLLLSSSLSAFILLIITIFIFEIKKLDLMKLNKVFNLFLVIAFLVSIFKISNLFMVNYALGKSLKDIEISYKKKY